jgi:hypothetical protein
MDASVDLLEDQDTRNTSDTSDIASDTGDERDATASDTGDSGDDTMRSDARDVADDTTASVDASPDAAVDSGSDTDASAPDPLTGLVVEPVTEGGLASSSKLRVRWDGPVSGTGFLRVSALEDGEALATVDVGLGTTEAVLGLLPSATPLEVVVERCDIAACTYAASATGTTASEVWRFQGRGHTLSELSPVVADGNVRLAATLFGADASSPGPRIQLYYGARGTPGGTPFQGLSIATTDSAPSASDTSSYLRFTALGSDYGVLSEQSTAAPLVGPQGLHAGHAVVIDRAAERGGPVVRLYFEASGNDGKTRIMSIDSKDGEVGRDFRTGAGNKCVTTADYQDGGPCALRLDIPVEGDVGGWPKIKHARQMKIGVPTHFGWRWNMSVGDFMIFTTDAIAGCSTAFMNQAWAVWDGARWVVQYAGNGCPKLFTNMQAPSPFHIEGGRYKMMFGDPSKNAAALPGSRLPFLGPKQYVYASAIRTGNGDTLDFEDWDTSSAARPIEFEWPDGTPMDDRAEGYIDDFHMIKPTGDQDLQVLYVAITDGTVAPITAAATLQNP